ncbi:putative mitochondrial protein [Vitis vinifera]|uniref:Putative mitochondrial protein n=1 Tax=Vitis vinifera TaxID=29760 RepID=A0A438GYD2_VITVI|nr:putative mitochondrial protein [Vitis vinifera]
MLVNGTPAGFFQSLRGLRQGDPLSPYLFVIAMEVFSALLKRVVEGGFISGCRVKGRSEEGLVTYVVEAMSGLRINLEKSELIPVGRVENIDDLAWDFGCRVGSLLSTYLGMPLGAPFKSVTKWDGVEERFRRSQTEIRENPKGLPLGWWQFGAKASFSKMRVGVLKAFNDWEVEEVKRFLERLHGERVFEDVEDMVSWTETKSGKFLVKSLYFALEAGCPSLFPSSYIWNVNVQPKISFFAWEATWGKTLTLDMVQKRGRTLTNRCFMCLEKEETIDHLLLHFRETLLSRRGSFVGKKCKTVWRAAPLHIFWMVWKARNRLTFKDDMLSI